LQVGSSFNNFLSKLVEEKESHHLKSMPVMDYIDISSSDDDLESWETDDRGSADPRILPQWASTRGTNSSSTGHISSVNSEPSGLLTQNFYM
jgi:hypothetical protein